MKTVPKKQSVTDRCLTELRHDILTGKYDSVEDYINILNLCKELKASRVTIRRCLARLQEENLLRSVPYKGYVLGSAARVNRKKKKSSQSSKRILYVDSPESSSVRTQYERLIWKGALEEATKRGVELQACRQPTSFLIDLIKRESDKLRGIALLWNNPELLETLLISGLPTVMVEYHHEGELLDAIIQDDRSGMDQAIQHLHTHGHWDIGLVIWGVPLWHPLRRRSLFTEFQLKEGVIEGNRVGTSNRFDAEGGREAVRALFKHDHPPTGLILAHMQMAEGVLDELESMGLTPGKDVSLVAWGSKGIQQACLGHSKWAEFPMDLIEWSQEDMGRTTVRMIEARWKDALIPPMRVEIPTYLKAHGSTTPLKPHK